MINNKKTKKIDNKTIYKGIRKLQDLETGEIIEVDETLKNISENRNGFEITYLSYLIDLFDELGWKKYLVFKYIIKNKNSENQLLITTKELSQKTGVSEPTVIATLKLLKNANLIQTRTGAIMLNPKIAHRGKDTKERYLLQKFVAFEEKNKDNS